MIPIGYLCARGHYCFHADPDENGECGGKSLGTLAWIPADGVSILDPEVQAVVEEANEHLGRVIDTWRQS